MPALRNPRQEALAMALAAGKGIMEAYVAAGYTGKAAASASITANRPVVQKRVQELLATQHNREIRSNERAIEKASIDKEWIVTRAKYIVEFGIRGKPILDNQGNDTGKYAVKPNLDAAGKSLALLARMGGYLIDRHEFGRPGDFARLTDEALDAELILVGESIGISAKEIQKAITNRSE